MRDDFDTETKSVLARRVDSCCSNPACGASVTGPADTGRAVNLGVAAHITAASPGGPRYDPKMQSSQRKNADNGIWLCQNCAKLIDSDTVHYSAIVLRQWKKKAEEQAATKLGRPSTTKKTSQRACYGLIASAGRSLSILLNTTAPIGSGLCDPFRILGCSIDLENRIALVRRNRECLPELLTNIRYWLRVDYDDVGATFFDFALGVTNLIAMAYADIRISEPQFEPILSRILEGHEVLRLWISPDWNDRFSVAFSDVIHGNTGACHGTALSSLIDALPESVVG